MVRARLWAAAAVLSAAAPVAFALRGMTEPLAPSPDGRLPGRRWRGPVVGAVVAIALLTACIPLPVVPPEHAHGWAMVPAFPERLGDVLLPNKPMYHVRFFVSQGLNAATPV